MHGAQGINRSVANAIDAEVASDARTEFFVLSTRIPFVPFVPPTRLPFVPFVYKKMGGGAGVAPPTLTTPPQESSLNQVPYRRCLRVRTVP